MALLGSFAVAGYFYAGAIAVGIIVLPRFPLREIDIPRTVRAYIGFYLGFFLLVLAHLAIVDAPLGQIDLVSRIGFGLINGAFFFTLFGFSREKLFNFIVFVAACHAAVASAVAIYQSIDFQEFHLAFGRAGGVTNPIPFSGMLLTSVGLVAIFLAGRLDPRRQLCGLGLITPVVLGGLFAVILTGTRGTLICFLLLLPLLAIALHGRLDRRLFAVFSVLFLAALFFAASHLFRREAEWWATLITMLGGDGEMPPGSNSTGIRFELWMHSLTLIRQATLLGHGLGAFPELFRAPELGLPANSVLFTFNHVHNQYLDLMLETGLLGTALFFGSTVTALVAGVRMAMDRAQRARGLAIIWVVGAYAIYGLTTTYLAHASSTMQYGVYLSMLIWLAPGGRKAGQRPDTDS